MGNTIIKYDRTLEELEMFLFFAVAVAGKTASITGPAVKSFFCGFEAEPFTHIEFLIKNGLLRKKLKKHRLGQYNKLVKFSKSITSKPLNLKTCTLEELETHPGVGPKTSRFFMIYTRPDQRLAVLDTHILAYLRDMGYDTPLTTPSTKKKYAAIEKMFLEVCEKVGVTPVELDDRIWQTRRRNVLPSK